MADQDKPNVIVDVLAVHGPASELGYVQNFFADGDVIYAAGGSWRGETLLLRSIDHGVTFQTIPNTFTTGLRDVWASKDTIFVVGDEGTIATTADAGKSWKVIAGGQDTQRSFSGTYYCLRRDLGGVFWATGDRATVVRSKSGARFTRKRAPTTNRVLRFFADRLDPKRPWLVGNGLYRWNGKAFVEVEAPRPKTRPTFTDMTRSALGALLVVGDQGLILRSDNDGSSWKRIKCPVGNLDLEAVLVTTFAVLVVGDKGTVLASNDDGRSFVPIKTSIPIEGHVWSIIAAGDGVLIGADKGGIYRLSTRDLAKIMFAAFEGRDEVVAALAASIRDGADEDAKVVLEDALRERLLIE